MSLLLLHKDRLDFTGIASMIRDTLEDEKSQGGKLN